jgi:hypothetical protein
MYSILAAAKKVDISSQKRTKITFPDAPTFLDISWAYPPCIFAGVGT